MIYFIKGNILDSSAQALVNTVNLAGVMGKGIALQFKKAFPDNFIAYKAACKNNQISIGRLFVYKEQNMLEDKIIINFPTKTDWRKPSEYEYIEKGLEDLANVVNDYNISSIAIPPLGAGNGGLNWHKVKSIIEDKLSHLDIDIYIYEPSAAIAEKMKRERVKLTDARALMLYVLFDLVRHGEYVSEFSSEKVCYFLQKFGADNIFNLNYKPNYYGPYSRKVKYVLNYLNGSYLMGYSDMNKRPFEQLSLVPDSYEQIKNYVERNHLLAEIAKKTMSFLDGFYSDFGLELLSSVDYILSEYGNNLSDDEIYEQLKIWTRRKAVLFSDKNYIDIARKHILSANS